MLDSPLLIFGWFLLGASLTALIATWRPHLTQLAALFFALGGGLFWWSLGRELPHAWTAVSQMESGVLSAWRWEVDALNWPLGGVVLLLGTAVLLRYFLSSSHQEYPYLVYHPALALLLMGAALAAVWAGTLAALLTGWSFFALAWSLTLYLAVPADDAGPPNLSRLFWLLSPLWLLALAAAWTPPAALADGWNLAAWPVASLAALSLAVLVQMGVLPFATWQPYQQSLPSQTKTSLFLLPPIVGAGLLMRLSDSGAVGIGLALALTLAAFLTMLSGLRRAWMVVHLPGRLLPKIALFMGALTFLVGLWGGSQALLSELRAATLGMGILFLLDVKTIPRARLWLLIPPVAALVSLAGLPLTAGFIGLSALYTAWWINGRYMLLLAAVILLAPMITAVILHLRDRISFEESPSSPLLVQEILADLGLFLPILGLFMLAPAAYTNSAPAAWAAILLALAGGLLLLRFLGNMREAAQQINRAFTFDFPFARAQEVIGKGLGGFLQALAQATQTLEGDRGLVWLLIFLLLYVIATTL